jgi:hypothetical protein
MSLTKKKILCDTDRVFCSEKKMWPSAPSFPTFPMAVDPFCHPGLQAKAGAFKQKFSPEEDQYLGFLVSRHGTSNWKRIASHMNGRTVRQCRERWKYYLEPSINKLEWTAQEDELLLQKYQEIGPKWAQLALLFHARTDIDLKNRYHRIERSARKAEVRMIETQPTAVVSGFLRMALDRFDDTQCQAGYSADEGRMMGSSKTKRIVCKRLGGEAILSGGKF